MKMIKVDGGLRIYTYMPFVPVLTCGTYLINVIDSLT